jgi:hypothetical protein
MDLVRARNRGYIWALNSISDKCFVSDGHDLGHSKLMREQEKTSSV